MGADMAEVAFTLQGRTLPRHHRRALAAALQRALPWLDEATGAGVHRLKLVQAGDGAVLVSPRTRLILRLPRALAEAAAALPAFELEVEGHGLRAEQPRLRELLPYGTLYAPFVVSADADEAAFVARLRSALDALDLRAEPVCGRWQALDEGALVGCSVMLSGLDAAHSRRVLQEGVGPHRLLGCGLFIPHKSAAAVGVPD